jgi:hypothetical protein
MTRERMNPEELKALAVSSDWRRVEYDLSAHELEEVETKYRETCLEIDGLEIEKKSATSHFGSLIKNSDTRREELRQQILTKKRKEDAECWLVPDIDADLMKYYDKNGIKVFERPLESYERQTSALEDFAEVEEADADTGA